MRTGLARVASAGLGGLLAVGTARAQPAPEDVGRALRVDLHCADYWAQPASGLTVTVDGTPVVAAAVHAVARIHHGKYGPFTTYEQTDVGFDVAAGRHLVLFAAPGCESDTRDLVVTPGRGLTVHGRLATSDPQLRGTTALPDGAGFAFGLGTARLPATSGVATLGPEATGYHSAAVDPKGVWLSASYEHRHLALAWDLAFLWGETTGTLTEIREPPPVPVTPGAMPYADTVLDMRAALRVGVRAPLGPVALAAGTGLAFGMRVHDVETGPGTDPFALTPPSAEPSISVPVWAALSVKPWCNGGFQLLASYDVHSSDAAQTGISISAGVLWQPSGACAESPGLVVR